LHPHIYLRFQFVYSGMCALTHRRFSGSLEKPAPQIDHLPSIRRPDKTTNHCNG
jgi:hypothetical protein